MLYIHISIDLSLSWNHLPFLLKPAPAYTLSQLHCSFSIKKKPLLPLQATIYVESPRAWSCFPPLFCMLNWMLQIRTLTDFLLQTEKPVDHKGIHDYGIWLAFLFIIYSNGEMSLWFRVKQMVVYSVTAVIILNYDEGIINLFKPNYNVYNRLSFSL